MTRKQTHLAADLLPDILIFTIMVIFTKYLLFYGQSKFLKDHFPLKNVLFFCLCLGFRCTSQKQKTKPGKPDFLHHKPSKAYKTKHGAV